MRQSDGQSESSQTPQSLSSPSGVLAQTRRTRGDGRTRGEEKLLSPSSPHLLRFPGFPGFPFPLPHLYPAPRAQPFEQPLVIPFLPLPALPLPALPLPALPLPALPLPALPLPILLLPSPLSHSPFSPTQNFNPRADVSSRAQSFRVSSNPALAELKLEHLNRFFRSLTVAYNESEEWWEPELSVDWRWDDRLKPVLGLRTEGACKASWAITAVTAVEMAYAIVAPAYPNLPPAARVSVQQVVDCEPSNSSCSGGGWPTSALDYMVDATQANGGLATEAAYPYTQKQGVCNATRAKKLLWRSARPRPSGIPGKEATFEAPRKPSLPPCPFLSLSPGKEAAAEERAQGHWGYWAKKLLRESAPKAVGVIGYDPVDFFGWLGLTLAVQTQPTIAFVRGSHPTFLSYRRGTYNDPSVCGRGGGSQRGGDGGGTYNDRACAAGVVDHSEVVVGYELDDCYLTSIASPHSSTLLPPSLSCLPLSPASLSLLPPSLS
ncbi:unnamed protein product [Closterium sp. NIES-64]|nr:unnamed protein product [Closterium sp. NIES-64]